MKKLIVLFLMSIWTTLVYSQQYKAVFPYTEVNGKMIVKAKIHGIEGRFIFDTGAPVCFTNSFTSKLNITPISGTDVQDSNGKITRTDIYMIDVIELGGVNFTNIQAMSFPKGNSLESLKIDGIIGYSLFAKSVVEMNGQRHEITIASSINLVSEVINDGTPMVKNQYVPLIPVTYNNQPCDTIFFDSGDSRFFTFTDSKLNSLKKSGAIELKSTGKGILSVGAAGLEEESIKHKILVSQMTICGARFSNVSSVTTEAPISRIGSAILHFGSVTIDYISGIFHYTPYREGVQNMASKDWNVIITVMDNELKVGFIWESASKKISVGEKIVEVNGQRFDKVDPYQAMTTNLVNLQGNSAHIKVIDKRSGKEKEITIVRE